MGCRWAPGVNTVGGVIASTDTVIETVVAIVVISAGGAVALTRWERGQRDAVLNPDEAVPREASAGPDAPPSPRGGDPVGAVVPGPASAVRSPARK